MTYCTMPNIKSKISSHNKNILNREKNEHSNMEQIKAKTCNCRNPIDCPVNGECLVESVVYEAVVKDDTGGINNNIGLTEGTFKYRYTAHK